ncbi:MAG: fasciclin domain-containing protein [Saprospiraceae bacterium]
MFTYKNVFSLFLCLGMLFLVSCGDKTEELEDDAMTEDVVVEEPVVEAPATPTIVGVAQSSGNFSTLVRAVQAADLAGTLNGNGPFTVFAPTDEAFNKLPAGTVDELLRPENKAKLAGVLTYHVVSGRYSAADILGAIEKDNGKFVITTVEGGTLTATLDNGKVMLKDGQGNMSTVVMTDVEASNGLIHAIDAVVMK